MELAEAVRLGKRVLPVLCRPLGTTTPPKQLADLNYLYFYTDPKSSRSGFGTGLVGLASALNVDVESMREHTHYLQRATDWDVDGRPSKRLLSGADIASARAWVKRRPKDAPASPHPTRFHQGERNRCAVRIIQCRVRACGNYLSPTARYDCGICVRCDENL